MKGIIRKTILGIWFFGGLSACTSKPHFTIEGSLDEKVDGEAYIVGYPGWNKKPDTLARAEIRDGKFTLTGSLPDTMEAGLYITGEKTYAILLLENADYRAHLHLKNPEANRVEGPELQLLFAAYQAIGNKTAGQTNELRNRYYSARQKNDTATMNEVMRTMGKLGERPVVNRNNSGRRIRMVFSCLSVEQTDVPISEHRRFTAGIRSIGCFCQSDETDAASGRAFGRNGCICPRQKGSGFYASNTRRGFFVHVFHPRESENPRFLGVVVCSLSGGKSLHGGTL